MSFQKYGFRALIGVLIFICKSAYAIPITYDEAVDGDLPQIARVDPSQTLDLGEGINSIFTTSTFWGGGPGSQPPVPTDFDAFVLRVLDDYFLTSIFVHSELIPGGTGIFATSDWALYDFSATTPVELERVRVSTTEPGLSLFESNLALGPGRYMIAQRSHSGSMSQNQTQSAAFSFSLQVASVPEAATIILMVLALIASLGFIRKSELNSLHSA